VHKQVYLENLKERFHLSLVMIIRNDNVMLKWVTDIYDTNK